MVDKNESFCVSQPYHLLYFSGLIFISESSHKPDWTVRQLTITAIDSYQLIIKIYLVHQCTDQRL